MLIVISQPSAVVRVRVLSIVVSAVPLPATATHMTTEHAAQTTHRKR
ncbi:hypothetical protein NSERUTF1_6674 [Nocardia seriolae]|nr:hypothetical protein NSERUTF1_6674 [Nocardia seriolae]